MQPIRIQQAESAAIVFELDFGEYFLKKHLVTVAFVHEYISPFFGDLLKRVNPCLVYVNEVIFRKWRAHIQSIEWGTRNKLFC